MTKLDPDTEPDFPQLTEKEKIEYALGGLPWAEEIAKVGDVETAANMMREAGLSVLAELVELGSAALRDA